MTDEELAAGLGDEAARAIEAANAEAERVGVDWDRVAEALLGAHPELAPEGDPADDSASLGLDVERLIPILRALPDGAGTAAFLEALERLASREPPPA